MTDSDLKVILMRGVVGSGKTTWQEVNLCNHELHLFEGEKVVLSTDDFWTQNAERKYLFDPKRIGEAHAWNFRRYIDELDRLTRRRYSEGNLIVIDNTNIRQYEMAPYILAASAHGVPHEIVTVWCDPALAAARNVHNVPPHVVFAMHAALLREELPPFWNHRVVFPEVIAK